MAKFSVIIPLYNKAPYIRKALDSVMAQTYRDFELIIVDDGSTDNSVAICEEYLNQIRNQNSKIINIRLTKQPNSGVSAARNNGVAASRGQYVTFLDADDWWKQEFLEEIDGLIKKFPDAGIYATNYIYFKPGKTHVALSIPNGLINYPKAYLHCGAMPVTSITSCLPRKIFEEMGGFPVNIKYGEDFLLWAKTALHYPIAFCEKPLAYYNNNVPASLRATRNLYAPEHHMLFYLDSLEKEMENLSSVNSLNPSLVNSWHQLFDWLRIKGLMPYWLSMEYHAATMDELKKVDWTKQSQRTRIQYEMPVWILRLYYCILRFGSYWKQKLLHIYYENLAKNS